MLVTRTRAAPGGSTIAWFVDNEAALAAIPSLTSEDVGRVAQAVDTGLLYFLRSHSPVVWVVPGFGGDPETISGTSYTLVLADAGKLKQCTNGSLCTVTVPPNASVAFRLGTQVNFEANGTGLFVLAPGSGVTLDSALSLEPRARYAVLTTTKTATNRWLVTGDMATP